MLSLGEVEGVTVINCPWGRNAASPLGLIQTVLEQVGDAQDLQLEVHFVLQGDIISSENEQ